METSTHSDDDKSWVYLFLYTIMLLTLTPFASYLAGLFSAGIRSNPNLSQSDEFMDAVKGVVSAALYLPLFLANKIAKSDDDDYPFVRNVFLPLLLVLSLAITIEYLCALDFFLYPGAFSRNDFLRRAHLAARTQWLYPLPFVVISLNLLIAARFIRLSSEDAEFFNDEFGSYLKFAATAIAAIIISAILRLGFAIFEHTGSASPPQTRRVFSASRLNLRSCPGTVNCAILQTLPTDVGLEVIGERGEWFQVRVLGSEGQEGWVSARYTKAPE